MKFISIRDLRNQSGVIQRTVREESVTLTSNGKPFALVGGFRIVKTPPSSTSSFDRRVRNRQFRAFVRRRERTERTGSRWTRLTAEP